MNKKKKPDFDIEKMGKNPFITNITLTGRCFDKEEQIVIQVDEGINIPSGSFKTKLVVEEQSCTKIWHDTTFRDILLGLKSIVSYKLFIHITHTIKPNEDFVWINSRLFQDKAGVVKKSDYINAVEELVRYGMITTTIYPDTYWINPLVIFSGNRLRKYPEHIKLR